MAKVFNDEEQQRIRAAIADAEKNTTGQVRVCIEKKCIEPVLDRAAKYFHLLDMHKTRLRNGVLIYVSTVDRKFAIIGDVGINKAAPVTFWDDTRNNMLQHIKYGNLVEGIVAGLEIVGNSLKKYFPQDVDDVNGETEDGLIFTTGD